MGLTGLMWWIDRWRKSSAYMDMTQEEQGALRNLFDEAFLRGGALPNDDRLLARASGDVTTWERLRDKVMSKFTLRPDGYHNKTLDEVLHQTRRRVKKQKTYRDKKKKGNATGNEPGHATGNDVGNADGNAAGNDSGNEPGYLDPDLRLGRELSKKQESSPRGRARVFDGERLHVSERQHQVVLDEVGPLAEHLDFDKLYRSWDAQLVASGETFDTLPFIKRRTVDVVRGARACGVGLWSGQDNAESTARDAENDRRRQQESEQNDELWLLSGEAVRLECRRLGALEISAFSARMSDDARAQATEAAARRVLADRFPGRDRKDEELARLRERAAVA